MDFFPFVMYLFHSFKDLHTDTSYVLYNVFSHATYGCANDKKKGPYPRCILCPYFDQLILAQVLLEPISKIDTRGD